MAIDYLRLSLTDRCNLNCVYCTPRERQDFLSHEDLLRHEELARAAASFVRLGVRKIRLTGGEPLLKKDLPVLVRLLRGISGLRELALTTNGVLLKDLAVPLREAGLDRVNVSLDSLDPAVFKKITGSAALENSWDGLMAALRAGFREVKLNMVVMRGLNDGEVSEFARLALDFPLTVRFIEFFPTNGRSAGLKGALVPNAETRKRVEAAYGPLRELPPGPSDGPARVFTRAGARGKIGFISGRSDNFCGACGRIRMDSVGRVYPCLFSAPTHSIRELLRSGAPDAALDEYLGGAFKVKPKHGKESEYAGDIEMSGRGG
ncbi:MAG: GTP 3',8-cyclase MoaA [Elusimicrobia bacterium]|nr:GTP 3',8-cyclase MoaA [Elusimicrobiota bacterium]